MKRRKQSPASAVIEASLQMALEQAQIIAASNHSPDNDQPASEGLSIQDGTQSAEPVSGNREAAIKRERNKKRLSDAYEAYARKEPGSSDRLMKVVRDFAYIKVYHLEYDFKKFGSAETADDWAQDVFISVWRNLEKFEGSGSNFYSWVSSIAFNEAQDAFTKLYKAQKKMTGLTIPARHNDSVDGDVEDNPEMLSEGGYDGGVIGIPKSVQGTDRNICLLIRDGRSYAGIAEELNMKVSAVKKRLQRLRERLQAEQAA